MAQLPVLIYDQKAPMTSEHFKALAESLMSEKDASMMKHLGLDPNPDDTASPAYKDKAKPTGCKFVDEWREWERTLRLNIAKNRAHYLKRESEMLLEIPVESDATNTAAKAVTAELNPLDAELLIDKARWITICSLAGHNYFGRNNVFAYYLKLVLMERKALFSVENGFAEYNSLYDSIIENEHKSLGEPK
jgi:hypothetical protein